MHITKTAARSDPGDHVGRSHSGTWHIWAREARAAPRVQLKGIHEDTMVAYVLEESLRRCDQTAHRWQHGVHMCIALRYLS